MEDEILEVVEGPMYDMKLVRGFFDDGEYVDVWFAYTKSGKYIGIETNAKYLIEERGIAPETIKGAKVCSIGFCEREQKWYGWSHRAIYGFGIGDVTQKGDCGVGYEEDEIQPGFVIETLADAKIVAIAFAKSVS